MDKFQTLGMQVEPVGWVSIELITTDGTPQSVRMGTMHAQLVSAASMRIEIDV
jgi:hypothetical protein